MDATANALSLLKLVVDGIDAIRVITDWKSEYNIQRIKLDIIQVRLLRWGEAIELPQKGVESQVQANELLGKIQALCKQKQKDSAKMKKGMMDPEDLPDKEKRLRLQLRTFFQQRRKIFQLGEVMNGLKWAFYEKSSFESFVSEVSSLVTELEGLFTSEEKQLYQPKLQELSNKECGLIPNDLKELLQRLAEGCDPWLTASASSQLSNTTQNSAHMEIGANHGLAMAYMYGNIEGAFFGHSITQNYGASPKGNK